MAHVSLMCNAVFTTCRTCVGRVVEGQVDMSDVRICRRAVIAYITTRCIMLVLVCVGCRHILHIRR